MLGRQKPQSDPAGAPIVGQMAGEYRISKKLGSGGFGAVYEAEHPVLKRRAAVKVLHASRSVDDVAVARFIAEAQAASQIRHRHIVDIFSFGKLPSGQHFYVMDLLEGAPLDLYAKAYRPLDPEVSLGLLRPVSRALDALHAAGLVHRDVKPGNIFLAWESSGEVVPKLLDFGLVKLLANSPIQTDSNVLIGTPYYMSPEQCQGKTIDARSDVYAFGVICHELLAGEPPFSGDTAAAVMVAHVLAPPRRVSEMRPDLPAELDEPVLAMLAKDPDSRPASVGAAFDQLEGAARRAGITVADGLPKLTRPRPDELSAGRASLPPPNGVPRSTSAVAGDGPTVPDSRARTGRRWVLAAVASAATALVVAVAAYRSFSDLAPAAKGSAGAPLPAPPDEPASGAGLAAPSSPAAAIAEQAAEPSAAKPTHVELFVKDAPSGAAVLHGKEKLGETPGPLRLPYGRDELELTIVARGYDPKTVSVVPSARVEVAARLSKAARGEPRPQARPSGQPLPSDFEDPF
jgi:eukaryotic-like serine/threonine-protein kinase